MTINEFLLRKLRTSGKEVLLIIQGKRVLINAVAAIQQQLISSEDQISLDGKILQESKPNFYIAYHKPRGIECTTNREIPDNMVDALPELDYFFPIGRLDKNSEGLMILTNDGKFYKKIAPSEALKEKEYIVTVDKAIDTESLQKLSEGVVVLGKKTRPCSITRLNETTFSIILTQGLNRQIRRMCYSLGYYVIFLKRIRIMSLELGTLAPGEYRMITKETILN